MLMSHDGSLAYADKVEERTRGRTDEATRPAFDTVGNVAGFGIFEAVE